MPFLGQVLLALGLDPRYILQILLALIVAALVVVLIVVETVATVLSGGQPNQGSRPDDQPTPGVSVVVPVPTAQPSVDVDLSARVVQLAETWLGVPYQFGGCSRGGVDCSCLVENVYGAVGILLPRVAVDQFNATVPIGDPQPGDLVFFANTYEPGISHVGIYLGGGLQVNAPTTGEVVSVAPVFTGYWGSHYAGAHRVRF